MKKLMQTLYFASEYSNVQGTVLGEHSSTVVSSEAMTVYGIGVNGYNIVQRRQFDSTKATETVASTTGSGAASGDRCEAASILLAAMQPAFSEQQLEALGAAELCHLIDSEGAS
jgi:hypothetical protein